MKRALMVMILLLIIGAMWSADASATEPTRRFLVSVGANKGSMERTPLRYAVTDAENFARLLEGMGGVNRARCFLLREPSMREFVNALETVRTSLASADTSGARSEVLFYYSGHADENGLMLGDERFSYQSLRDWMKDLNSDLEIAILDACASGAITRLKGGTHRQAFLVDSSVDPKGYAFLTSSSENEAAQESERLKGSFFTHYLVSGLRGAADSTGDGKVTLNEAYQFAYNETLVRTAKTQGGTQHPAYDMKLVGTGDVVITDVRETSAGLILAEEVFGRIFVRNSLQQLVVELQKPAGREIQIGLEPGEYSIDLQQKDELLTTRLTLTKDQRHLLSMNAFEVTDREPTVLRGGPEQNEEEAEEDQAAGTARRHAVGFGFGFPIDKGFSSTVETTENDNVEHTKVQNFSFDINYQHRITPEIAMTITTFIHVLNADIQTEQHRYRDDDVLTSQVDVILPTFFGVKVYPVGQKTSFQPYLSAGLGPVLVAHSEEYSNGVDRHRSSVTTELGGMVGGGIDVHLSRIVSLNFSAAYQVSSDYNHLVAGKKKLEDTYFLAGIGFQFGSSVGD
jgi:outer membrane protein W